MPIRDFSTPAFASGGVRLALARRDDVNRNQYMLVLATGYGMAETRKGATLNCTTSSSAANAPALSPAGHPLIWFDANWDREPGDSTFPEGGLLNSLLAAEPPVVRLTGRGRTAADKLKGGERVAQEVEILLDEDELAHVCCYCGEPELVDGERWKLCNDTASQPAYCCPTDNRQSEGI
ncbi:uncharacterized protein C8Q71DRAFT_868116 [Rhodofomes roseus]|uniref:Uncharacterized protein n=1 Tax=Rhodofomes roseus TaxID=34475 RepID=A0ABQ8KEA6_9APHY|nr:uncharacterized protein C8Q71DRAFT_868116 [Rhodofomes roseus]KAH9836069.1 hypothetical protein C8Q71DRAFT_868116 [Rhodofomes roseus]